MDTKHKDYIAHRIAHLFIKINAVSFRFDPPFTFTTGLKSPIYLDNRVVMSHPKERREIVNFYIQVIGEVVGLENVDYISATASAAIPHGAWISGNLNLPMVFVRPTTKSYGKGNKIEGYLKPGSKVLIIEDHISTAASVVNNAETIRESGGKVAYCLASTTYETEISNNNLKKSNVKLISLTTGKIIAEEAFKNGLISKENMKSVKFWLDKPFEWEKKFTK